MKIKAAIHYEYHKPLVIEEVEIDPPGDNDVLIKITATGICHSDVHCKHDVVVLIVRGMQLAERDSEQFVADPKYATNR